MRALRVTLIVIGAFQLVLGLLFLVEPGAAADLIGLTPAAPAWADWLFAMMAARFLGYAYGMFIAVRDPRRHRAWIDTMIVIQAVDWVATLIRLAGGDLHLRQVTTAAFMPVLFITSLLVFRPRPRASQRTAPSAPGSSAR